MMQRIVWLLCALAITSWGSCVLYPTSDAHLGWIGTVFGSSAGLVATILSYQTEDTVATRGGVVYKDKLPTRFLISHAIVGLLFTAFLFVSILGFFGLMK